MENKETKKVNPKRIKPNLFKRTRSLALNDDEYKELLRQTENSGLKNFSQYIVKRLNLS